MNRFFVALFWLASLSASRAEIPVAVPGARAPLDYMLVITGEELLRGAFPDAHTSFITRTLHMLGCHCVGSLMVDDKPEDIQEALRFATRKAKLVIVTGGLGPTVNDVTRGAVSDFTGIKLAENAEALQDMERRLGVPRDQLRANLRRQTLVPVRGAYFKNPQGTAVGLVFESEGSVIVALPGPPRELQPMVMNQLVPYLKNKYGARPPGSSLTVRFVGVGQSQIDQTMREYVTMPADVVTGSVFEAGRVDFIFALPGDSNEDRARLAQLETDLRKHLGEFIYSTDSVSLEAVVLKQLKGRFGSLALVEIGSGGHLAARLNETPGIDDLLKAAYVAPTEQRMRQMLDITTESSNSMGNSNLLTEIANAAQKRAGSKFVIVVGDTTPERDGKTTVPVAFGATHESLKIHTLPLQGVGELAHANLITQILDRLRK